VRPGPWRERILHEYREAIERIGFDGIQADQYGFREQVHDASGAPIDMASALGDMVGAAQQTVRDAGGDGIIFNCVNNWPIRHTAREPQLCTYIELWPPHVRLQDLADLVNGAHELAPSRQVILAAYMSCAASAPDAEEVTLLTSAAIHASGGFHLLLGEGDGILTHPYFPNFVRPGPHFQRRLVDHWSFIVRYGAYLFDRSLRLTATTADKDSWRIHRAAPRFSTVSVLNAHPDDLWDSVKPAHPPRHNVAIDVQHDGRVGAVLLASPDEPGPPQRADFVQANGGLRFAIPRVRTWTLAIIMSANGNS
jgi:dextranase